MCQNSIKVVVYTLKASFMSLPNPHYTVLLCAVYLSFHSICIKSVAFYKILAKTEWVSSWSLHSTFCVYSVSRECILNSNNQYHRFTSRLRVTRWPPFLYFQVVAPGFSPAFKYTKKSSFLLFLCFLMFVSNDWRPGDANPHSRNMPILFSLFPPELLEFSPASEFRIFQFFFAFSKSKLKVWKKRFAIWLHHLITLLGERLHYYPWEVHQYVLREAHASNVNDSQQAFVFTFLLFGLYTWMISTERI